MGKGGTGVKRYQTDPKKFLAVLEDLGLLSAIAAETNRELHWTDPLVERLRSGRGSAISGQRRGRSVEDFSESVVTKVFGNAFDTRCTFTGPRGQKGKCDFAIPAISDPRILIEVKGYGATGSKMTDVIGDIKAIINAKRADTAFLLFTDGVTWRQRQSDLRKPAFLTGFRREESETPSGQGARPEGTGGVLDSTSRNPTKRNAALADGSGAVADNS